MGTWDTAEEISQTGIDSSEGLTLKQFEAFHEECKRQPPWRANADKESDYLDNNQLDSEVIRKQQAIGMPPAIDPLMGPELDELCGLEARLRKNWRVVPNSDKGDDEIAEAMNVKLNDAERHSKAGKACSIAFRGQAGVGVAWVCVDREPDPFKYPYRTSNINRNDCWWDWKGTTDPDTHDHRYFIRRRWTDKHQAKLYFPHAAELIEHASNGWATFDKFTPDGGTSTGLQTGQISMTGLGVGVGSPTMLQGTTAGTYALLSSAYSNEMGRGDSLEEAEWRDIENNRVCIFEVWYRVWQNATVFRMPDGRTVEYDPMNEKHLAALATGTVKVEFAVISKVHVSMWIGPHKVSDEPSPFKHNRFPYVPFWGKREDRTGVPYGLARGWIYHQDTVNALSGKLRWGISATRTRRTKGAYAGTDEQFRREAARLDADIVMDPKAMKEGGVLEIERDFQLTDQQANLINDSRRAIKRTGMGVDDDDEKNNPVQQLETIPNQHGILFDNFKESRNQVGELLLSMVIEDMEGEEREVVIPGNVLDDDKSIVLNERCVCENGEVRINNDLSRALLKVVLEDVPSTPSYRGQQFQSFSEVIKSSPEKYQPILYPHMLSLMDVPNRDKVIEAIRAAGDVPTEDEINQRIEQAVNEALMKANMENKSREITLKEQLQTAQIDKMAAETVTLRTQAFYEAMQGGGVVAAAPGVAPIADEIMKGAGYVPPTPVGVSPNIDEVQAVAANAPPQETQVPTTQGNTNPSLPMKPRSPAAGVQSGIETPEID